MSFAEVTTVFAEEVRLRCLHNKNSTRNSSEIVLPVLPTRSHHQDGLFGPLQTLTVLLRLLYTLYTVYDSSILALST